MIYNEGEFHHVDEARTSDLTQLFRNSTKGVNLKQNENKGATLNQKFDRHHTNHDISKVHGMRN